MHFFYEFFEFYYTKLYLNQAGTTVDPNGIRARVASLKCCFANGIPIIVMNKRQPIIKWKTASSIPETRIQNMFKRMDVICPLETIFFPKGQNTRPAYLKSWNPNGIPIIVQQRRTPAIIHPIPQTNPPAISQMIFPSILIKNLPKPPSASKKFLFQTLLLVLLGEKINLFFCEDKKKGFCITEAFL